MTNYQFLRLLQHNLTVLIEEQKKMVEYHDKCDNKVAANREFGEQQAYQGILDMVNKQLDFEEIL